jgi:hypothetical protein
LERSNQELHILNGPIFEFEYKFDIVVPYKTSFTTSKRPEKFGTQKTVEKLPKYGNHYELVEYVGDH